MSEEIKTDVSTWFWIGTAAVLIAFFGAIALCFVTGTVHNVINWTTIGCILLAFVSYTINDVKRKRI